MVTVILITINCILALFIPNIGAAMTIVGCTINPIMGYLLPVFFYWKLIPEKSLLSSDKLIAMLNVIFTLIISILSIIQFFYDFF